ncbi:pectinesterase inhibitor-like [Rhododendron vialii]|uniref:pectinesterase inhibitor-like n=1 Tax=Rhododendron vialii TaxID=182163 RepID=UPI00265F28D9|nr:pectinesterase inhibitor-like [Rhododendron vialii]
MESDPGNQNEDLRGMIQITLASASAKANETAQGIIGRNVDALWALEVLCTKKMWIYVVFILHSIIISSSHSSASNLKEEDNLMTKVCKSTRNFTICYSHLKFDNRSLNADVKGLARIIIEKAERHANTSVAVVNIYTGEEPSSRYPVEKKCRGDIHRLMYGLLPEAIRSLDSNDYGGAKKSIQNAADIADACKDELARSSHGSLRKRTGRSFRIVHSLCLVALDIISTLG